jgi:predicted amidophosphoribosyltransferase
MSIIDIYKRLTRAKKRPRCQSCGDPVRPEDSLCQLCCLKAQTDKLDEMIMKTWRQDQHLEENIICLEGEIKELRKELYEFLKGVTNVDDTSYSVSDIPDKETSQ